jgi:peptidoglycan/LPS O-acetylase OafA/YrhL
MSEQSGVDAGLTARQPRVTALDALRGVGALVVVLYHLDICFDIGTVAHPLTTVAGTMLRSPALRWLIAGRGMVLLFFVLSGYALSLSLENHPRYGRFLVRRFTRLALPGIATVLLAAALYALGHSRLATPGASDLYQIGWVFPFSWGELAQSLLMTGTHLGVDLDPPLWSLVIELRMAIVFPALYFLTRRWPGWMAVTSFAYFVACFVLAARKGHDFLGANDGIGGAFFNLGYFAPLFIFGILVKMYHPAIRGFLGQFPRRAVVASGLVALALTGWQLIYSSDFRAMVGSVVILTAVTGIPELGRAISVAPLRWLGRVSFSLYLVHLPVANAVIGLLHDRVGRLGLAMTILVGSLLLAEVFYRLVEAPAMALGRRWTREPQLAVAAGVAG